MSGIKYPSNRLKQLRQARDLSLRMLSEKTGVDFATISFCEKGQRNFSANSLKALTDFFGVSADYLLGKSPEQMFNDAADSLRGDFMTETLHGDGDVTQSLSSEVSEPVRTKIEILLLLRGIDDPALLSAAYSFLRSASAGADFADDAASAEQNGARVRKLADILSGLGGLSNDSLDLVRQTVLLRKGD